MGSHRFAPLWQVPAITYAGRITQSKTISMPYWGKPSARSTQSSKSITRRSTNNLAPISSIVSLKSQRKSSNSSQTMTKLFRYSPSVSFILSRTQKWSFLIFLWWWSGRRGGNRYLASAPIHRQTQWVRCLLQAQTQERTKGIRAGSGSADTHPLSLRPRRKLGE